MVARFNFLEMEGDVNVSVLLSRVDRDGGEFHYQPCWRLAAAYVSNQTRYPLDLIRCCNRQNKLQFYCRDKINKRLEWRQPSLQQKFTLKSP